ncbi:hypothetical protein TNIN_497501 [Trichonephila inaurata madagascariensis]|uniref:Uncharacterized protein n=1 Tax=Trichonephila inaurata madagascariensis TaxID=2747483 RepID=A0A8X7CG15_9ARAC|nr:hypothetical protein TNIN_497501 [Trichonephila inaurata madagascariensis]
MQDLGFICAPLVRIEQWPVLLDLSRDKGLSNIWSIICLSSSFPLKATSATLLRARRPIQTGSVKGAHKRTCLMCTRTHMRRKS